jgi:periplasmic protein CpxP/Spy
MKRILLPAALVFALCGSFALAQQPDGQTPERHHHGHHAPDPQKAAAFLSKKLNLTPDQTAKIEPILAAQDQKMAALKSDGQTDPKAHFKEFHAIHQDTEKQLAGVLTPEQLQQMKAMHHGFHGHGPRDHRGAPPAPPAA